MASISAPSWLRLARRPGGAALGLWLAGVGVFLAALDQTVVVTALPAIMMDTGVPLTKLDQAAWIVSGYLLGYTVAMPFMGRLADVYGYVRLYLVALLLFGAGSALVALSNNLPWLVGARVLQAVGGGATIPIGVAMVASALPAERRGLAVGLVAAVAEAGAVLGPLYGGSMIKLAGWRWVFWINLPLVAVIGAGLLSVRAGRQRGARMDYTGGIALACGLTLLTLAFSRKELFTGGELVPYVLLAAGAAMVVGLVALERRAVEPVLPVSLLKALPVLSSFTAHVLIGVALIIALVTVPLMADTVLGQSALEGGLRLMRLTGAVPVGAVLGGWLVRRIGNRTVAVTGLVLVALAFFWMGRWELDIGEPWLTLSLAVGGLGFGLVIAPVFLAALGASPAGYWATASSVVTVGRMVGMTLGLAALAAWGITHFQALTAGVNMPLPLAGEAAEQFEARVAEYQAQISSAGLSLFRAFFRVGMIVSLAAVIPALGLFARRSRNEGDGQQEAQTREG